MYSVFVVRYVVTVDNFQMYRKMAKSDQITGTSSPLCMSEYNSNALMKIANYVCLKLYYIICIYIFKKVT